MSRQEGLQNPQAYPLVARDIPIALAGFPHLVGRFSTVSSALACQTGAVEVAWTFEQLTLGTHADVRQLILDGLGEHWGELDVSLNPDLDDMLASYATGVTLVAKLNGETVGTGTILPRSNDCAEIVRMSVATGTRRTGLGHAIIDQLLRAAEELGCTHVVLETTSAWTGVVAFYLACGFRITHTEQSPFGEDTWFRRDV